MIITPQPLYVRLFINNADFGHSESYALATADYAVGLVYAQKLAQARSNILPQDATIEWAVLAQGYSPYTEQCVISTPLESLPQWGLCSHTFTGLLYRFETATGEWVNRFFKPIDARFISNYDAVNVPRNIPSGIWPLPTPINLATTTDLFLNCFTTFRDLTAKCVQLPDLFMGLTQYALIPWSFTVFRKVSSKASSHRWRRVSWEPEIYTQSPAFSPCGQAVSVLHNCYYAPCRFYTGSDPQRIHYYWASNIAQVFPLQHIFWGRARAKQISNSSGVGELTGAYRRSYSKGFQWGVAVGDHYSGGAADFLGQSVLPWTPEFPTPEEFRPACDFPRRIPGGLLAGGKNDMRGPLIPPGGLAGGGKNDLVGFLPSTGGLVAAGGDDLYGYLESRGGLAAGGKSDREGTPRSQGGLAAGGVSKLLGPLIPLGGLSGGGTSDRLGQLRSLGGLAAAGKGDLFGVLKSGGGLDLGGQNDLTGVLPSAGGLEAAGRPVGATGLIGELPSTGGLAGGGNSKLLGPLISTGGLAGGGTAKLLGPFIAQGGLSAGGKDDVIGQLISAGGVLLGGKNDLVGQLPSAGGLAAGGQDYVLENAAGSGLASASAIVEVTSNPATASGLAIATASLEVLTNSTAGTGVASAAAALIASSVQTGSGIASAAASVLASSNQAGAGTASAAASLIASSLKSGSGTASASAVCTNYNAVLFSGSSTSYGLNNPTGLPSGNVSVTLCFWIKFVSVFNALQCVWQYGDFSGGGKELYIQLRMNGSTNSWGFGNGTTNVISSTIPSTNTKYHVILTVSGGSGNMYINNSSIASGSLGTMNINLLDMVIGGTSGGNPVNAHYQDMRMYNRVITSTERGSIFNSGVQTYADGVTSGLVGWWKTLDQSGTNSTDSIGSNTFALHNATFSNM